MTANLTAHTSANGRAVAAELRRWRSQSIIFTSPDAILHGTVRGILDNVAIYGERGTLQRIWLAVREADR